MLGKNLLFSPRQGADEASMTWHQGQGMGSYKPLQTPHKIHKPQRYWCWRPVWLIKWGTLWGGNRQSHCSVVFSLKHPPTAPCCKYIPPGLWMSPHLGKPCRAAGRWAWPAAATASSRLHTDEVQKVAFVCILLLSFSQASLSTKGSCIGVMKIP